MKKKIVLLLNVKYNYETVVELNEDGVLGHAYDNDEYATLSEVIEVDFPDLPAEDVVKQQVESIDNQITKARAAAEIHINALIRRKQELLAITCDKPAN